MFQIEIFEYSPKLLDYHTLFLQDDNELDQQTEREDNSMEVKFNKIHKLSNPVLARYIDYIKDDNYYVFISEYEGSRLDELIDNNLNEDVKFKEEEIIKMLYELLVAINYLETHGISLAYLEPKRILLSNEKIKIRSYIVDILFRKEELKFVSYNISLTIETSST